MYFLDILGDIGNAINVIVTPFRLIYEFITLLVSGLTSLIYLLGTIGSIFLSICLIIPSPLYETFCIYVSVYIFIITFKLIKGLI